MTIWKDYPDWRFGQLVYNIMIVLPEMKHKKYRQYTEYNMGGLITKVPLNVSIDPFHLEDDDLEKYLMEIMDIGLMNFIHKYQSA